MKTAILLLALMLTAVPFVSWLNDIDTALLLGINRQHTPYWDTFMWLCSRKLEWVPLYVSIVYVVFRNYNWRVLLWCLLAVVVVMLFTDTFTSQVVRPWIGRLRPSNLNNPVSAAIHIVDNHRGGRFGFPSSHASNTWGLVFFVQWLFRRHWLTLFLALWAMLVCYSRLYLGVHYPGDLLAGLLFGFVGATIVYLVFVRLTGQRTLTDMKHPYAPIIIGLATIAAFLLVAAVWRIE